MFLSNGGGSTISTPINAAIGIGETRVLQANLASNLNSATLVAGNSNTVLDTVGNSNWQFYVSGGNSIASISSASASSEWTAGSVLPYILPPSVPTDMAFWYTLNSNKVSGNTITDSIGNYSATLSNGATISTTSDSPGPGQGFLALANPTNGINQHVILPSFATGTTGLSVSCWFRSNASGDTARIFEFSNGQYADNIIFGIVSNKLYIGLFVGAGGGNTNNIGANSINDNVWRHVVLTLHPTAGWQIYLNAVSYYTNGSGTYPGAVTRSTNYIGKSAWGDVNYFNGGIDDFRVYNRVITADEVSLIYSQSSMYYPFETADINPFNALQVGDYSSGSYIYNGTLVGGATIAVDSGSRIAGKGYLKATSTAHKMSLPPVYTGANGLTFALWFKMTTIRQNVSLFDFNDGGDANNQICVQTAYLNTTTGDGPRFYTIVGNSGYGGVYVGPFAEWTHFVFVLTPPGNFTTYVNGSLHIAITGYNYPISKTRVNHNVLDWKGSTQLNNAGVDDFRFYNRAITVAEITALYNGPPPPSIKDSVTGATWMPTPAAPVDASETLYTVKSNEVALKPGTNSTYAVWTAPKSTNIKVDVSFADYHSRSSAGVGFQMFKINSDNTFGSVIFPRTVTSAALTNANPNNYLSVPSKTISVATGDKIYYRVDANGNTTASSSVLSTNIYVDPNQDLKQYKYLQAHLGNNLSAVSFVAGNANVVNDTLGTGSWNFYVAGGNSIASVTGASASSEWTVGNLLSYVPPPTTSPPIDYSLYYTFNSDTLSGNTIVDSVSGNSNATLTNGAATTTSFSKVGTGSLDLTTQSGTGSSTRYLRLPTFTISQITGWSVSFWMYQIGVASPMFIFEFAPAAGVNNNNMLFVAQPDRFDFYSNLPSSGVQMFNTMTLNQWVHICITIRSNNRVTIYKNSTQLYSEVSPGGGNSFAGTAKTFAYLGSAPSLSYPGFKGYIDDFKIYNKELTATEVNALYSTSGLMDANTGTSWMPTPGTPVDSSETSYTIKSNEVALKPGTNSTYAVWTATKSTNIKVDVSFADYHTRSAGVGFQIFKINSNNTFDSVLFPRTVTSAALTDAAPTNYLPVPSVSTSVVAGDKIYLRVDANGNTTAASSVLATSIYTDAVSVAQNPAETRVLQANLASNLNAAILVFGNANTVLDTVGTGNWKFYVASSTSVASITSASASSEWTGGSLLSYFPNVTPVLTNYSLFYPFSTDKVSGTTVYDIVTNYPGTLYSGATIAVDANSRSSGEGYLKLNSASSQYMGFASFTPGSSGISFSFWFYANNSPNWGRIFEFSASSNHNLHVAIFNNNLTFTTHTPAYRSVSTIAPVNNQWYHVVWTIASNANWIIYIDKTIVSNTTQIYPSTIERTENYIGKSMYNEYFNGGIDNFRYYNYVLSQSNVNTIYDSGDLDPSTSGLKNSASGVTWMPTSATPVDASETNYTVKSTEIALTPGTNSTYAVWTAPKTTNIRLDVSFADYHSRSAGVGFQIFKINSDNTFGSVIFPRTVTSTALTDAAPTNYLSVPSKTISVTAGDKIYYRIDANGNTTSASSVLATNIYSDNNYIPPLSATNINEQKVVQAQLATNLNNATLVSGTSNTVLDTVGTGNWKFYVASSTSVASITSASASSEWTGGSLLSYIEDYYVLYYNFDTTLVSGNNVYNNATQVYDASLVNATIVTTSPSPSVFGSDRGYLVCSAANYLQINGTYLSGLTGTSIALWINVNGTGGDIFNSSDGAQSGIQLSISGGNSIVLSITNNAGDGSFSATLYTNAAVNNGSWHHIALVMTPVSALSGSFTNSSGKSGTPGGVARWQLFFDGTSVYNQIHPTVNCKYPDYIVRGTNKIGPITALIDDFRVYNIELTTSNIAVLYSRFSSWYKFNSATGNNTIDSINGNTAVLSGGASIQTATPSPIGGGYVSLSSALQQYITIPQFGVGPTSLGYSFFFKTELSSAHKILTSFSISQFNAYVTLGIVGNNVYLNMNLTNGLAYSAGGATFQNSFSTFSNLTSHTGGDIAVSVDDKIMVTHKGFNASVAQSILLSNFSGSTWGVPTIIGSMVKLWNLAITSDGKRIVATQKGGYVFVSTWNGTSFSAFVQTSDATSRTYTGLGMTADGSRIVCCTNESGPSGNVYMALWNESTGNYNAFTTIVTGISTSIGYDTMCISVDGFKIAYSSGTTGYWAMWNGIVYVQQTSFTCVTALNMKFTIDSNVLLMTTNSAVSAIYSMFFNGTTYASLTAYGGTSSLLNKNLLGFHVGVSSYFYLSENGVTGGPYRNRVYWGTSYRTYRCNTITDNRWHNIYFNFYSPYFFEYWFDGNDLTNTDVLTNVDPNFGAFYSNKIITTNYIGLSLNSPLTFFDGSIDDLRFYNRRLSAAEMSFLMTGKMYVPQITSGASGPAWAPTSATAVDSSETSYTVKSTEVALKPGTNSTYAVWTAPRSTNIRVDVSFADYHTRSAGVGFQIFKINSDNTFGSVLFPRTVTSTALTDVASTNYLTVPSVNLSVATGDKIYYRVDANGNTTAASSVLATNIYSYSGKWS